MNEEDEKYSITTTETGAIVKKYISKVPITVQDDFFEEEEISEYGIIQAEILLNQLEIQEKLEEQEVILAEILLNSL